MGAATIPASASEALDLVRVGLRYLAADATELTAEEQAECLLAMERVNSVAAAARTSVLGAFTAGKGYSADADPACPWTSASAPTSPLPSAAP